MNAVENVALPLSSAVVPRVRRREMAEKYLKMVGLEKVGDHMPNQMSGGQQQRVGIARALVVHQRSFCRRADWRSGFAHDDGCAEDAAADRPGTRTRRWLWLRMITIWRRVRTGFSILSMVRCEDRGESANGQGRWENREI
ncbi:MAG: ATP-binding cassette domain-containing protein [Clostridium fessum]